MSLNADIKPQEVGPNTNEAGALQAIVCNSQAVCETKQTQEALQVEVRQKEGQQESKTNLEAKNSPPSSRAGGSSSKAKAKGSTEGDVYADVALESSGVGTGVKVAKTLYDGVSDMDPGKQGGSGMATMENFTGIGKKAGAGVKTKHSFDLASKGNLAGGALRGDTGKTSTWCGVKNETTIALKAKLVLEAAKRPQLEKSLGNAVVKKAELGAIKGKVIAKGMAPGGGGGVTQLSLNQRAPKGPNFKTAKVEEETSIWSSTNNTDTATT